MKNIPEIESRLVGARTDLTAALERGCDTTPYRSTVVAIERELAAALAEQDNADRAQQRYEQQRLDNLSVNAVREAHRAVAHAAGSTVIEGVDMPAVIDDPAIASAAAHLVAARDRLGREEAIYQSHNSKVIALRNRLTDKESAREALLARRRGGDEKPTDAGEIILLAEDISSLKELVADAHRIAEQHRPAMARRLVQEAEAALVKAKAHAVFTAKQVRLQELERAFLAAHAEMVEAGFAIGERNKHTMFTASQALRTITYGTTY